MPITNAWEHTVLTTTQSTDGWVVIEENWQTVGKVNGNPVSAKERIETLGAQGWELVSAFPTQAASVTMDRPGDTRFIPNTITLLFKKQK